MEILQKRGQLRADPDHLRLRHGALCEDTLFQRHSLQIFHDQIYLVSLAPCICQKRDAIHAHGSECANLCLHSLPLSFRLICAILFSRCMSAFCLQCDLLHHPLPGQAFIPYKTGDTAPALCKFPDDPISFFFHQNNLPLFRYYRDCRHIIHAPAIRRLLCHHLQSALQLSDVADVSARLPRVFSVWDLS